MKIKCCRFLTGLQHFYNSHRHWKRLFQSEISSCLEKKLVFLSLFKKRRHFFRKSGNHFRIQASCMARTDLNTAHAGNAGFHICLSRSSGRYGAYRTGFDAKTTIIADSCCLRHHRNHFQFLIRAVSGHRNFLFCAVFQLLSDFLSKFCQFF